MRPFVPKDSTRKEHIGLLDKVVWADDDRPVSILALTDGASVIVDAPRDQFTRGQAYRFLGRWQEGKRGPEFKAGTFVHHEAHGRGAVVKYLTEVCEGVGQKIAERLFSAYGPGAVQTLREQPERVAADGIMGEDAARTAAADLERFAALEQTRIDLFGLLAGRGFPGRLVGQAIARWGARAPEVIRTDAYKLLTARLPGCGWKRCDKLFLDLGGRRAALKRQALAGWNALREDRSGSTWLPAAAVVGAITDAVPGAADPVKAVKLGIRGGLFRLRRDGAARWVAVADVARAEQRIADNVRRLSKAAPRWPAEIPVSAAAGDGLPSGHQAGELRKAFAGPVGAFVGGPGTGKTHTLSFALNALVAAHGEKAVAVAAPTGIAAVRATKALAALGLPIRATTIHQLLEIGRNGHDGQGWGFLRDRDNPLSQRFVVIDESSMVDTLLMADLLDACGDGTHVLFVGDPYQLPPVGPGAPLRDFLSGGVAAGELTETRRNAGMIVTGCRAIKDGRRPEVADRLNLLAPDPVNLRLIECGQDEALGVVEDALRAMSRFDPAWDCQILCPTNDKSELSRRAVNARLGKVLNPDGRRVGAVPFATGDKVICLKNSKLKPVAPAGKFRDAAPLLDAGNWVVDNAGEVFAANGEIGRVAAVGMNGCVVTFPGDRSVWVPKSKPKAEDAEDGGESAGGGMGDWDLAWGITGHKSQGSEWPIVFVLADKAGGSVADRAWWYTAISRASQACVIVGDRAAFETQCRRQSLAQRTTFLADLLRPADPE